MEIDRKELKQQAREAMRLTKPSSWVLTLIYMLMTVGVSMVLSLISLSLLRNSGFSTTNTFFNVLYGLYAAVVDFGFMLWCLWAFRRLDPGTESLTQGFSIAGRVIILQANIYVRTVGWTLCVFFAASAFLLPLVIAAGPLGIMLGAAGLNVAYLIIKLRYALAPYMLADNPDAGPAVALRRSVQLMRGWKLELFKLLFSFLGWELINGLLASGVLLFFMHQAGLFNVALFQSMAQFEEALFTVTSSAALSIATQLVTLPVSLWLMPYRGVALAGFYDARLRAQYEDAPTL